MHYDDDEKNTILRDDEEKRKHSSSSKNAYGGFAETKFSYFTLSQLSAVESRIAALQKKLSC